MARPDKVAAVEDLADKFRSSNAVLLTEYRGLTVAQLKELRTGLGSSTNYAVVKNTLASLAAKQAGIDGLTDELRGPSALAFVSGDPVDAAKSLRDFTKANPALVVKSGVLDGRVISAEEVGQLADLDSREVTLAKLAGAVKATLTKAAQLFAAPATQVARAASELRDKQDEGAEAAA